MEINEMKRLLQSSISESRYLHTLGVIESAKELAILHGADDQKACIAALLHDAAKRMDVHEMIEISNEEGFPPDEFEISAPAVLHAPAGAAAAKRLYGISDPDILHAIRSHTIGCQRPTKLDAIVFVADFIEPGRKPFNGLEEARKLAETNLLAALKKCAELSMGYVVSCGGKAHPTTVKMINDTEELI
ncbi:MAG: bis(5'-nucleosyl)-tetraphosphatase (symmetrical) YqeK [Clostridia bacterium]|nr:bis(5'-nucleosyl)-tetraphosphatase (symmetrical) YqeK [Clostridia bacterium]